MPPEELEAYLADPAAPAAPKETAPAPKPPLRVVHASETHAGTAATAPEQSVLGAALLGAPWDKLSRLQPHDFSRADHRLIFSAMRALAELARPLDVVTVAAHLAGNQSLEAAGGMANLGRLARETPTAENVGAYVEIVLELALHRRGQEIAELERKLTDLKSLGSEGSAADPPTLRLETPADWSGRPAPAPRDWAIEGLIPAARVTSFLGNGGLGKTTISATIAAHIACNRSLWGQAVAGGPVLGIFCEDEREEMERRIRAACAAEELDLQDVDRLHLASRDGMDNVLCTFEREQIVLTDFYRQTETTVAQLQPRLLIIDTAADVFAGDFMSTPQVRQFIKVALGGLCVRYGCAVLLIAHPSASAMTSGDGGGFSTAWNNSVRSRLYLRRPKSEDLDAIQDRRVLEVRKSNYAADGLMIPLIWDHGCFVLDREPIEESARVVRSAKPDTRLTMATLAAFREKAPSGEVLTSGAVLEYLQATGALPKDAGKPEAVRKRVQRTLEQLKDEKLIVSSKVPRGYRLIPEAV